MPNYDAGPNLADAVGVNRWMRSTKGVKFESHTFVAALLPDTTLSDGTVVKVLQPGLIIARITAAGATQDMVGPYLPDATDGRQTAANIVGINNTYLPTQLNRGNQQIAVAYDNVVAVQDWCLEINASDVQVALTQATADAIEARTDLGIIFRPVNPEVV